MIVLPSHLPICRADTGDDPEKRALLERLMESLADHGVRAVRIEVPVGENGTERAAAPVLDAAAEADLVLVDGPFQVTSRQLLVGAQTVVLPEPDSAFFCTDTNGVKACRMALDVWLRSCLDRTPVGGCVLVGGRSSRMGRPKQLLRGADGRSWLELTVERLRPFVSRCVLAGAGDIPLACSKLTRVADLPGVAGPLAGIGAVLQLHPWISWLVVACDMPDIQAAAIEWLLACRRPGARAVIPVNPEHGRLEPLFAWYDFRCLPLLQRLLRQGSLRPSELARDERVLQPEIPADLVDSWRNVNRPEEL